MKKVFTLILTYVLLGLNTQAQSTCDINPQICVRNDSLIITIDSLIPILDITVNGNQIPHSYDVLPNIIQYYGYGRFRVQNNHYYFIDRFNYDYNIVEVDNTSMPITRKDRTKRTAGLQEFAVDYAGNIFVCDSDKILKYPVNSDINTIPTVVAGGNGPGNALNQLRNATKIELDMFNNMYVMDYNNITNKYRLLKFPPNSNSSSFAKLIDTTSLGQFGFINGTENLLLLKYSHAYYYDIIQVDSNGFFVNYWKKDYYYSYGNNLYCFFYGGSDAFATYATNLQSIQRGFNIWHPMSNTYYSYFLAMNEKLEMIFDDNYNQLLKIYPLKGTIKYKLTGSGTYSIKIRPFYNCEEEYNVNINYGGTPSISIQPDKTIVCPNSNNKFKASLINASESSVSFNWKLNGNIDANQHGNEYNAPYLNNGDTIVAEISSACFVQPVQSNKIGVNPNCGASFDLIVDSVANYFDTINVSLRVTNANNLFAVFAKLDYSPYLKLVSSQAGSFLGTNLVSQPPIVTGNTIDFGMSKTSGQAGNSGSGEIYSFRFKVINFNTGIPYDSIDPRSTLIGFLARSFTVTDPNGLTPVFGEPSQQYTELRYYIPVWPGDLNNDKKVNVADILPIGYFYNTTGPRRPNASLQWIAQPNKTWATDATNINSPAYKVFADGNGNGIIDLADQNAIGFNLNKFHAKKESDYDNPNLLIDRASATPLEVNISDTIILRNQLPKNIVVPINLGNSALPYSNLYGIAFDLLFDPAFVDVNNITMSYSNNNFGTLNTDYIKLEDQQVATGRISIGLTRYNTTELNGYGNLVEVTFPIKAGAPAGYFKVTAVPIASNDKTGLPIIINRGQDSVRIEGYPNAISTVSDYFIIALSPNPYSFDFKVRFTTDKADEAMFNLFDITGKLVFSQSQRTTVGENTLHYKPSATLSKGVYFYDLKVGNQTAKGKLIKE
ncbi:MAG: T9SS type A sorting domain-containing protein [Chitinophagales bacterium]